MSRISKSGAWRWLALVVMTSAVGGVFWFTLHRPANTAALESRVLELIRSGRRDEARREAELLVSIAPRSVFGNLSLGSLAEGAGEFAAAAAAYQRVTQADASQTQAWLGLGRSLLALNQFQQARTVFEQSTMHGAAPAEALSGAGRAEVGAGNLSAGEQLFRKALQRDPAHVPAMRGLGIALTMQPPSSERRDEAERLLSRSLASHDNDPDGYYWLAVVQHDKRNPAAAASAKAALAHDPDHRGALRLLAQLRRREGKSAEAAALESRLQVLNATGNPGSPEHEGGNRAPDRVQGIGSATGSDAGYFADITATSGIQFELGHSGRAPLTILDTAGCGGGFLDYDGDGRLDLLLISEFRIVLYRQVEGGLVKEMTAALGIDPAPRSGGRWMGCATGDMDADGDPDVYLSGYRCSRLLRNDAGKFFSDITRAADVENRGFWETSATFFDYDRDGKADLYVARYVEFGPGSQQLCSIQGVQTACPPEMYRAEKGVLYHNEGGRFRNVTRELGLDQTAGRGFGAAAVDYDEDRVPDLYVANDTVPCDLFRPGMPFKNRGLASGAALTERGVAPAGMGVDWGDYDGDGRLDLFVTTFQRQGFALFRSEGGGLFRPTSVETGIFAATLQRLGFGTRFADVDLDGDLDLVTANGHVQDQAARIDSTASFAQEPLLLLNEGGQFRPAPLIKSPEPIRPMVGRGLACGDWDNDGRPDLLLVDAEGSPRLLRNETPTSARWLGVKLRARRGDRDGRGALLRLTVGSKTLLRHAHSDGSYLSAGDPRVLFGLGSAKKIERLEVRWPSGARTIQPDLPIDRYVTIEETP